MFKMENEELFYYLALQSVVGIGPIKAKKLLNHFGGAKQLFQATRNDLKRIKGLRTDVLEQLNNSVVFEKAEKEMRFIENNRITALTHEHEAYPAKLKHCPDAPLILFSKQVVPDTCSVTSTSIFKSLMLAYDLHFDN